MVRASLKIIMGHDLIRAHAWWLLNDDVCSSDSFEAGCRRGMRMWHGTARRKEIPPLGRWRCSNDAIISTEYFSNTVKRWDDMCRKKEEHRQLAVPPPEGSHNCLVFSDVDV